ncbi:aldehyde dehydrogenase family protein, partial [Gelidibacter japonicus]|uniref:aldehyde dehydrogenase family protein n=1 Tax=Gelidibacter japonicus TaxID=1962232 RepID=UPI003A940D2A
MTKITSINPYSGEELESFKPHSSKELQNILKKANDRFLTWRETSFEERKILMLAAVSELKNNKLEYDEKMTLEVGKPIS